jgi:uncharacterized FAD-dependent dehydrogenase
MKKQFDVIIVGAGPAGIFTALELSEKDPSLSVLIIEKGSEIEKRKCPLLSGALSCATCPECAILSGWGGAGAFSDGKLGLSPDVGGYLERYISKSDLVSFIEYVDAVYLKYGAPEGVYGEDEKGVAEIKRKAALSDLLFVPSRIRHIGTDKCLEVLRAMESDLRSRVNVAFKRFAKDILVSGRGKGKRVTGVRLDDGTDCMAGHVVLAPGREGSKWLEGLARRHKLDTLRNPVCESLWRGG